MVEIQLKTRKHKSHRMNPASLENLKSHRFAKGNTEGHGRPPKPLSITESLRGVAGMIVTEKVDISKMTFAQAAAYVHWQKAVKGNQETYEFITNRLEGKPQDKVDVTSKGERINDGTDIRTFIAGRISSIAARGGTPGDTIQPN